MQLVGIRNCVSASMCVIEVHTRAKWRMWQTQWLHRFWELVILIPDFFKAQICQWQSSHRLCLFMSARMFSKTLPLCDIGQILIKLNFLSNFTHFYATAANLTWCFSSCVPLNCSSGMSRVYYAKHRMANIECSVCTFGPVCLTGPQTRVWRGKSLSSLQVEITDLS